MNGPDGYIIGGRMVMAGKPAERAMARHIEKLEAVCLDIIESNDMFPAEERAEGFCSYGIEGQLLWDLYDTLKGKYRD